MISLNTVSKTYDTGASFSLQNINLEIAAGEVLVLLGGSGSGKTTVLKMINRLVKPSAGEITFAGQTLQEYDLIQLRRQIGYVFQGIGLFPHLTIFDNLSLVLKLRGASKAERLKRACELLSFVNLPEDYLPCFPHELSGGEQQRIGVARALATSPQTILMDEPFGAIDAITRDALQEDLLRLRERLGLTIVFVTHDVFEALRLGDRIAVMDQGRLIQVASPKEIIQRPSDPFVRDLFALPMKQARLFAER